MTPTKSQTPAIALRRYEPGDREAVRRLHDEALNDVGAHLGDGPWDGDLDAVESVYLQDGGEFLVGVLEASVVAMGALRRDSEGRAWITRMRVCPRLQGRGVGQTLLDALHRRAAELGYGTLHLDTTVQQTAARRLYEKNGYRETGRGMVGPFECLYYERKSGA
ncbi:MAG TPA: GNAT family N-acetyltransferase [Rubrobacter sp.]|nr:GNAT family N-acetyltransferase [Rubrobacter sp.]